MRPESLTLRFAQDVDSCGPSGGICNILEISVEDAGGGYYAVIKTDRWALDENDLEDFVATLKAAIAQCEIGDQ